MNGNEVDRSRMRAPALGLYVMAGLAAVLIAALMLQFGAGPTGFKTAGVTSIPVGWLVLSPLARLARRRGGG